MGKLEKWVLTRREILQRSGALTASAGFVLQIGSGHGWPIHVDYVRVWQ